MAKERPDLIDAGLTNFFFFRSEMQTYGPSVPHISFFDFFGHRYQLNLDGTVAAYRLGNLLAGSSLVLKQASKYYEFYYHLLQPGVHYIPISDGIKELVQVIEKLQKDDNIESESEIIKNARSFVLEHLMPTDIYCYYYTAISEYTKLLIAPVKLSEGMEFVSPAIYPCTCERQHDEL